MKKVLLVVLFTSVVVGSFVLILFFSLVVDFQPSSYTKEKLVFAHSNDTLYLKRRTGANEEILVISTASGLNFEADTSSSLIFDVSNGPVFYKQTADSLIIYTETLSEVPVGFRSGIKIAQIAFNNSKMMDLLDQKNYLKMGLKKYD